MNSYVGSVILYIAIFTSAPFVLGNSQKKGSNVGLLSSIHGKTCKLNIAHLFAILIPAFFAGIRYGIGTDYNLTYVKCFNTCRTGQYAGNEYEYLFFGLNYLVSLMGGNVNTVLFIAAIITLAMYTKGLLYYTESVSAGFSYLFFLFLFYNNLLNNTRQWVALSIVFYGIHYCFKKDFKKYLVSIIIAMGFHISAACALPLYFVFSRIEKNKSELKAGTSIISNIRNIAIIIVVFFFVFLSQYAVLLLERVGLGYYIPYLTRIKYIGYLNWVAFARYFPWILAILYLIHRNKTDYKVHIIGVFSIIGVAIEIIAMHMQTGGFEQIHRMSTYFTCFLPLTGGALYKISRGKKNQFRRDLSTVMMIGTFFVVIYGWINDIVINNANATLPYISLFTR